MSRLIVLGYWFQPLAPTELPRPQLLVGPWEPAPQSAVLRHLRQGRVLVQYDEATACRFDCGHAELGSSECSDGRYVWPAGLPHYIEAHSVLLPPDFVAHALASVDQPPLPLPKPRFGLYDLAPWRQFAHEHGAVPDLTGFAIPIGEVLDRVASDVGNIEHAAILLCNGETRQVLLLLADGSLALHQLRRGGHASRHFAGWQDWPHRSPGSRADAVAAPRKKGGGEPMGDFLARLRQRLDQPPS